MSYLKYSHCDFSSGVPKLLDTTVYAKRVQPLSNNQISWGQNDLSLTSMKYVKLKKIAKAFVKRLYSLILTFHHHYCQATNIVHL